MAKAKTVKKPKLQLCAADWTLTRYPSAEKPWSADTRIRRAKEAGFVGFSSGAAPDVVAALRKHDMQLVGGVDVGSAGLAESRLMPFKEAGAFHINVQLCDHDTETKVAVKVARKVMQVGARLGIQPAIEVHRDTCTETPEKTYALADAYSNLYGEKLRMNFDHSHPAIIKQVRPEVYWQRLGVRLDLLKMGELIHFRPFTGSHCQTPITDGRGQLDLDFTTWRDHFLSPMLEAWLKGARAGKELWAVVELGPKGSGYGMACFPDIWKDAIVARGEIERVWKRALRKWRK